MTDPASRILARLAAGPKRTRDVAPLVRHHAGSAPAPDLATLHALWKAGRIRWDWEGQRWEMAGEG